MKWLLQSSFMAALLVSTSCTRTTLDVRSEYVTENRLASTHMDTPDPRKMSKDFGQQITICWYITSEDFGKATPQLTLHVRYADGDEKIQSWPLSTQIGTHIFTIFGDDYTKKKGLESYLATIEIDGKTIAESHHKLWVHHYK